MRSLFVVLIAVIGLSGCGMMKEMRGKIGAKPAAEAASLAVSGAETGFIDEGEPRPMLRPERGAESGAEGEAKPAAAPETTAEAKPTAKPKADPNARARASCLAKGGTFQKSGGSDARVCVTRTRDANKSCSASSQCEGMCLARSGTCAPITPLSGCHDIVTNGGNMATVCID
jgi:hypothetical protein